MAAWKLPLVVAAIVLPIVLAFMLGGGGVGVAAGAAVAIAVVVIAAQQKPRGPIGSAVAVDERQRVLLVVTCPIEEPEAIRRVLRVGRIDADADVLVLAPAHMRFLDRWASDVEDAREAAQRKLVATVAALAKAGVTAEARVGDEDVVQAVEDQLQSFPANEVVLAGDGEESDGKAITELESRLAVEFRRVRLDPAP